MHYPIDVEITPPRSIIPELRDLYGPTPFIYRGFTEPEIKLRFNDGSEATFTGPIVKTFMKRRPVPGERLRDQIWFPILYPWISHRGY